MRRSAGVWVLAWGTALALLVGGQSALLVRGLFQKLALP